MWLRTLTYAKIKKKYRFLRKKLNLSNDTIMLVLLPFHMTHTKDILDVLRKQDIKARTSAERLPSSCWEHKMVQSKENTALSLVERPLLANKACDRPIFRGLILVICQSQERGLVTQKLIFSQVSLKRRFSWMSQEGGVP